MQIFEIAYNKSRPEIKKRHKPRENVYSNVQSDKVTYQNFSWIVERTFSRYRADQQLQSARLT